MTLLVNEISNFFFLTVTQIFYLTDLQFESSEKLH